MSGSGVLAAQLGVDVGGGTPLASDCVGLIVGTYGATLHGKMVAELHVSGLTPGAATLRLLGTRTVSGTVTTSSVSVSYGQQSGYTPALSIPITIEAYSD